MAPSLIDAKQNSSLNSLSSSKVNTTPASQEDREYLEKVKEMEKYVEPLRMMLRKENSQDKLFKIGRLLDILSNPDKRVPIATLQKCEDVLKRMELVTVEQEGARGESKDQTSALYPLLVIEDQMKRDGGSVEGAPPHKKAPTLADNQPKKFENLKKSVECPVCLKVPRRGPIFSCPNDHILCGKCKQDICPICREALGSKKSLLAVNIIENIFHDCKFEC